MSETADTIRQPGPSIAEKVRRFFFAREVPYGMALVRILLPAVLMVDIVRRWPWAREFYSTDGASAPLATNFGYPGFLPEFSAPVAVALFTALMVFLATASVGWCSRISLIGSTVLYFYFAMLDCLSTINKYSVISVHLLLLLSLSHCGDLWSVDAWLRRRRIRMLDPAASVSDPRSSIWAQRLAQILFGMIYFGAAVTKMHTPEFFSGDQLVYWMMTYINNEHPLGDYLSQYPLLVSISGFITFLWEIVFVFTVWDRRIRWYVLAVGTVFHVMTFFALGLIIFPIVMVGAYLAFLEEADVKAMLKWPLVRGMSRWLSVPPQAGNGDDPAPVWRENSRSMAALALTLCLVCPLGACVEHALDHYKMRGPDGPLPLRELTEDEARAWFAPDRLMRQCDKLLAFDLGGTLIGEHLAGYRKEFRQGEQLIAQVTLNPPHEDMWIDCQLCEARPDPGDEAKLIPGRLIAKIGQPVLRENFRGNFYFMLDESLDPGDYFVRLRSGNEEVSRKHFRLLPGDSVKGAVKAAAAN